MNEGYDCMRCQVFSGSSGMGWFLKSLSEPSQRKVFCDKKFINSRMRIGDIINDRRYYT